jgi:hypothetical protein
VNATASSGPASNSRILEHSRWTTTQDAAIVPRIDLHSWRDLLDLLRGLERAVQEESAETITLPPGPPAQGTNLD